MLVYLDDDDKFFESHPSIWEKVQQIIEMALEVEKVPYECEISLTIVNKDEMKQINNEHREIDRVTDVLSFPQIEASFNGVIDWNELEEALYMNLDTGKLILGDIILCIDVAKEQAIAYNHSLEREICFLVAHSMYHLLGYDHLMPEEEKLMIQKQEDLLQKLGICR